MTMRVAAVTVNWNQPTLTRLCLESLIAGTHVPEWIIAVDNASATDPTMTLRSICPQVIVVRNAANLGFAGGANVGIRAALTREADAVLIINNDAVAAPDCVAELAAALSRDPRLAGAGAKTLTQEQPPRIHTAYGVLTHHGQLVRQEGWFEPDITKFSSTVCVDYISGCAMLLRRSVLEEIGPFDPEFFAYHEDLDWCTRARRAGHRVAFVGSALVDHRMHASTGGGGYLSAITYLSARNAMLFMRKNGTWAEWAKYLFYLAGNLLKEGTFRYRRGELAGFRLRLRGMRDGLLRRAVPLNDLGLSGSAAAPADRVVAAPAVES